MEFFLSFSTFVKSRSSRTPTIRLSWDRIIRNLDNWIFFFLLKGCISKKVLIFGTACIFNRKRRHKKEQFQWKIYIRIALVTWKIYIIRNILGIAVRFCPNFFLKAVRIINDNWSSTVLHIFVVIYPKLISN